MALWPIAKVAVILVLALLLGGCAAGQKQRPWEKRKWYQSDMENEDKAFFIDSFFKSG